MSDVFLGVIAVSVFTMAAIQVGAIVFALRTARRVGDAVSRFEDDVRPIVANLKSMSADAARTASVASAQVQRAEQLLQDLTDRLNVTVAAVEANVVRPAREAYAVIQGLMAAFGAFRQGSPAPPPGRSAHAEEEDPLFIG